MLAYGGGSIKRNGVYDEVTGILCAAGKRVVEFSGIMPNPTYAKVQAGAKLAREEHVDLILAVGGGSVSDCCKIISAQAKLDEDIWEMEMTKRTYPSAFIPLGAQRLGHRAEEDGRGERAGGRGGAGGVRPRDRPADHADGAGHPGGHRPARRGRFHEHHGGLLQ